MALAREALTIVLREQRGCLQSFETDEIGRLMAVDRLCRRLTAEVEDIWRHRTGGDRAVVDQYLNPALERAIKRLVVLAPDYVPAGYLVGRANHQFEVVEKFRAGIYDRKRECIWERLRRAQLLVTDFKTDIADRFPEGSKPGLTAIQNRHHLHTPSGVVELNPLRLALIAKLQRLVPELYDPLHVATAADSGNILREFLCGLNGRAIGRGEYDHHILVERCRARQAADRQSGDAPSDSTGDEGKEEEEETEDESMD